MTDDTRGTGRTAPSADKAEAVAWQQLDDLHIDSWGRGKERSHAFIVNGSIALEVTNGTEAWRATIPAPWVKLTRAAPPTALLREVMEALTLAKNDLVWYRHAMPEADNPVDDKVEEQIDAALAKLREQLGEQG